jgi:hypothetical protein
MTLSEVCDLFQRALDQLTSLFNSRMSTAPRRAIRPEARGPKTNAAARSRGKSIAREGPLPELNGTNPATATRAVHASTSGSRLGTELDAWIAASPSMAQFKRTTPRANILNRVDSPASNRPREWLERSAAETAILPPWSDAVSPGYRGPTNAQGCSPSAVRQARLTISPRATRPIPCETRYS